MSCTLKELQNAEYEILCQFVDYCEKHSLNYLFDAGSVLGAVRHDGFIPWDDDIDVMMDYKSFKKFIRLMKKEPIEGLHLTWIDTEYQSPFPFAKLRKEGTYMPEKQYAGLKLHNGVWIDVFTYINRSNLPHIAMIQGELYCRYTKICWAFQRESGVNLGTEEPPDDKWYRFCHKAPGWLVAFIRKMLLFLVVLLGSEKSEYVLLTWWFTEKTRRVKKSFFEPVIKHKFEDREFNIPENYDEALTFKYGDYMTPVKDETKIHTVYDDVIL